MSTIYKNLKYFNFTNDLTIQFETVLRLSDNPALLGFYTSLILLHQLQVVNLVNQDVLVDILGITKPTFTKRKKELCGRGLLEEEQVGRYKKLILKVLPQLPHFDPPNTPVGMAKYLKEQRANLGQTKELRTVRLEPKEKRFPANNYKVVLEAYKKYKGINIKGAEANIVKRAAKTMFKSERTVKNILDFMKWISENENKKGMEWLKSWTIWTVQKKMPEFVAKKLVVVKQDKELEDSYDDIR